MTAARVQAVFFDFTETLGYMPEGHFSLYVRAAAECGVTVTAETLAARPLTSAWGDWMTPEGPEHLAGSSSVEAFHALRARLHRNRLAAAIDGCPVETLDRIGRRIVALEAAPEHYALFEDTQDALARLAAAAVPAFILSNHIWELPDIVDALGLSPQIQGTITSARAGYRKPHPGIFAAALGLAGIEPQHSLMVGDSLTDDVHGATNAGMQALLIDRSGSRQVTDDVPVIRSLLEVPVG